MKRIIIAATALGLLTLPSFAQTNRERAIMQCVVRAQQEVPATGHLSDPEYNHMYNVYANCMQELGQSP